MTRRRTREDEPVDASERLDELSKVVLLDEMVEVLRQKKRARDASVRGSEVRAKEGSETNPELERSREARRGRRFGSSAGRWKHRRVRGESVKNREESKISGIVNEQAQMG